RRDVYERDIRRFGSTCTSLSTSVVLPVPDGGDTMNSSPRRSVAIVDLLPHPFELRLGLDDQLRDAQAVGLRSNRVDFAVHFLEQAIQLAGARRRAPDERVPMRQVAAEPRDLLADVGALRHADDLLSDRR